MNCRRKTETGTLHKRGAQEFEPELMFFHEESFYVEKNVQQK